MPSKLERLDEILATQYKQNEYISRDGLRQSIAAARDLEGLVTKEYPLMMFLHGDRERYKIVGDAAGEAQAASEGYIRTANPPDPNFPKYRIEDPQKKRWDYRGVTLRSKAEEAQWQAAVNVEDWIEDSTRQWGARPIGLQTLVVEHKEKLKRMVDENALEFVKPSPPADADEDAKSASEF